MKDKRHRAILEIVSEKKIETQEELGKELHLIKVQAESGIYKYAVNESSAVLNTEKLLRVFKETVLSVRGSGNLVVIGTLSGSANAAGEAIDSMRWPEVLGTISGDNTIFVAVRSEDETELVVQKFKEILK